MVYLSKFPTDVIRTHRCSVHTIGSAIVFPNRYYIKLHLIMIDKPRYIRHMCHRFRQNFGGGRISRIVLNCDDPIKSRTQYKHPLF